MDYCALAADKFLNSTFFNTLIMGILSALLVVSTILIAWRQYCFQKKSHEQQLLAAREDRILGIYKTFAETNLVLMPFRSCANISFFIFPEESKLKKLRDHCIELSTATDEAKLLFEKGAPLIKRLEETRDNYMIFLKKMLDTKKKMKQSVDDEVEKIKVKYSLLALNDKDYLVNNPDIFQELKDATRFPEIEELEKGVVKFYSDCLSDEKLDDYFKPYINRIPCKKEPWYKRLFDRLKGFFGRNNQGSN